jgi:hypothetical protein
MARDLAAEEVAAREAYAAYAGSSSATESTSAEGLLSTPDYSGSENMPSAPDLGSDYVPYDPSPAVDSAVGYDAGSSSSSGRASSGTTAPSDTFTFSSDAFENVGGVRMINMAGFTPAPGKTYKDYTLLTEKKAGGTVSYKTMLIPEGEAGKDMSRILTLDETTGKATYGKPTAEEPTALQSLYKSPQFMAPVVSSVLNGLAQSFIAERMAKDQRNEQRRMLDAQFQLANAKEEADMAERRRVSKRYWELKKRQGRA